MKNLHYILLIAIIIGIFIVPLMLLPEAEFGGADGGAEQAISDTGYEPWFNSLWEPPSGEIESLLFALQAAIGAMIIGYFVGYEKGKKGKKENKYQRIVDNVGFGDLDGSQRYIRPD